MGALSEPQNKNDGRLIEKIEMKAVPFNWMTPTRLSEERLLNFPQAYEFVIQDSTELIEINDSVKESTKKEYTRVDGLDARMAGKIYYTNGEIAYLSFSRTGLFEYNGKIHKDKKRKLLFLFTPHLPEKYYYFLKK